MEVCGAGEGNCGDCHNWKLADDCFAPRATTARANPPIPDHYPDITFCHHEPKMVRTQLHWTFIGQLNIFNFDLLFHHFTCHPPELGRSQYSWISGLLADSPLLGCRLRCKQPAFSVCPSADSEPTLKSTLPTLLKIHFISNPPPISLAKLPPNAELAVQIRTTDYSWTENCRNVNPNSQTTLIRHKVENFLILRMFKSNVRLNMCQEENIMLSLQFFN